jgi:hypothetical protein
VSATPRRIALTLINRTSFVSIVLTGLFIWPLLRSKMLNSRTRRAALRTCVTAFIGLVMSTVNVAVITALHGHEFGWLCLGSCSIDVISNTLALFWVTSGQVAHSDETYVSTTSRVRAPSKFAMSPVSPSGNEPGTHTLFSKGQQATVPALQITVTTRLDTDSASGDHKVDDNLKL